MPLLRGGDAVALALPGGLLAAAAIRTGFDRPFGGVFLLPAAGVLGALGLLLLARTWVNRWRVAVRGGTLLRASGPIPDPILRRTAVPASEIDQVFVEYRWVDRGDDGTTGNRPSDPVPGYDLRILRRDGSRQAFLGPFPDPEAALFLEEWIERRLRIEDRHVDGERSLPPIGRAAGPPGREAASGPPPVTLTGRRRGGDGRRGRRRGREVAMGAVRARAGGWIGLLLLGGCASVPGEADAVREPEPTTLSLSFPHGSVHRYRATLSIDYRFPERGDRATMAIVSESEVTLRGLPGGTGGESLVESGVDGVTAAFDAPMWGLSLRYDSREAGADRNPMGALLREILAPWTGPTGPSIPARVTGKELLPVSGGKGGKGDLGMLRTLVLVGWLPEEPVRKGSIWREERGDGGAGFPGVDRMVANSRVQEIDATAGRAVLVRDILVGAAAPGGPADGGSEVGIHEGSGTMIDVLDLDGGFFRSRRLEMDLEGLMDLPMEEEPIRCRVRIVLGVERL